MEKVIEIDYLPRSYFVPIHETKARWIVVVAHRRSGKTTMALNHLQRDALAKNGSRYAYIAPTYKQAKNVAWDIIKHYSKDVPGIDYNEAELAVKYPNGSRLSLYGADNPDSLRGIGLWGVVFDEYSQQPSNIFTEIIRPALADHSGYAIWIGTPKGKNEFYRLYEQAEEKDWLRTLLTVEDTGILPDEELRDAKKIMSKDEYEQEFYCSFEAAIKGAFYADELARAREDGRITDVPHEKGYPVHTWWDLGISDSTVIGFFQNIANQWRLIDYYENSGEGLEHYINYLQDKGYIYGSHFAPHDIEVRELGSGQSRLETAKRLGINFRIVPNLDVMEGINAARRRFGTLWIDEDKCSYFLNALSLYRKEWDDKRGEFKPRPYHDWTSHGADMLRYWAVTNYEKGSGVTVVRPQWKGYNKGGGVKVIRPANSSYYRK